MAKKEICPSCLSDMVAESLGWKCKKCGGFISMLDGKFYGYVEKPFMPPMTNADRIRAMSDEELAKWLCGISTAECCDRSCPARDMCDFGDSGMIKWLKQPAEGE